MLLQAVYPRVVIFFGDVYLSLLAGRARCLFVAKLGFLQVDAVDVGAGPFHGWALLRLPLLLTMTICFTILLFILLKQIAGQPALILMAQLTPGAASNLRRRHITLQPLLFRYLLLCLLMLHLFCQFCPGSSFLLG